MGDPRTHLHVRRLSKRFGVIRAVTDVDLEVRRGSIHAIVGENGAGKSTLGKIVAGAVRPSAGEVRVDGRPLLARSPRDALRLGIGTISQEFALMPTRTVVDNVFLGTERARAGIVRRGELRARFEALRSRLGFALDADALVEGLSVPDCQKVEIMRALARDASLIVMDEPTAGLSAHDTERFVEVVKELAEAGTTVVFISHYLAEVLALADVVTVMRDGRVVRTAPTSEETPDSLITAMLGRPLDTAFPPRTPPRPDAPVRLSVRGLTRAGAFEGVSLSVRAGEIVGLAGLVGCGRSEIARAICGADQPDAGEIEIDGCRVDPHCPRDAIRHGLVMLPESRKEDGLMLGRSIVENVTLPHLASLARLTLIRRSAEERTARESMDRIGVDASDLRRHADTLSGGNQQKLLFARWLMEPPRVLIADEPTRGIDVGAKHAIYELILALAERGMGVVMISSELEEVVALCHRVLVVRDGRIAQEIGGADASVDGVLRTAFSVRVPAEATAA
ncbi:MAG: sugar ABC transporter ATP-binding protein [Thermoleophilaceae bacterium]